MKRKNTTRNALFTSIISLLLCVSMLVGTTFAWFTDSVESGRNTIAAGNLDVELYANGERVTGDTILFDDVTPNLWEPGAVAYEDLQIKNVGSLALQYSLTLDVLNETIVNGYKLSDVIMVGIVEGGVSGKTRDEAVAAVTTWTKLANFKFDQNAVKLEAGHETPVYGVVLYWQPNDNEVDNRYNMNNENQGQVLKLEIGVSLIATQVMHEKDSFGDDYDEEATPWIGAINTDWYFEDPTATSFTIDTVDELAGLAAIVNGTAVAPQVTYSTEGTNTVQDSFSGKTITLTENIDLAYSTWTPIGNSTNKFQGTFDGNGKTISNLKVTGHGSNVGLFGFTTNGEIKNLTVENADISGRLNVGVVAGTPYTSKYTNITVKGDVKVEGMAYVGGVGGKNAYADWTDITVNVNEGSYVKATSTENGVAYRSYVGGVIGFNGEGSHSFKNITSNINVIGDVCDIGGAFGIAHYNNKFENVTVTGNVSCTGEADEIGGIAGVWHNQNNTTVTMTNVSFTGTVTDKNGVVSGRDIVGGAYTSGGTGELIVNGVAAITNATLLQSALDAATGTSTITLGANITGDVTVTEKDGVNITIDGNGYTYAGAITVNGNSARNTGSLTIQNVNFNAESLSADAYINLGGNNDIRYTDNVTVKDCTFSGNGFVAIKSYTGGDMNLTVSGCTVNAGMHSMLQVTNVEEGLTITGCYVYSKNGINLNNTPYLNMSGCEFDVTGYAVRIGVKGEVNPEQKLFTISNSTLKSACAESDDAVIVFRANATNAKLILAETTVEGTVQYLGNTNDTVIIGADYIAVDEQKATIEGNAAAEILTDLTSGESLVVDEKVDIIAFDTNNVDAQGATVVMNGTGPEAYGYLAFMPDAGEDVTLSNLNVTGSGFVCVGYYGQGGGTYVLNNVNITDFASTLKNTDKGFNLACAFMHYGDATLNNCVMTGTTAIQEGAMPVDLACANGFTTVVNGGEYGTVYCWSNGWTTIDGAEVDTMYVAPIKGSVTIKAGSNIGTINIDYGIYAEKYADGSKLSGLVIEDGATVGTIIFNGTSYSLTEWNAYIATLN